MKKRHGVLALLGAVSVITFIDRLAIAVAGPGLQHDVHLTAVEWGWVLTTVVFGYVIRATGNYNLPLFGIAAVVLISAMLFSRVDCSRGLNHREPTFEGDGL